MAGLAIITEACIGLKDRACVDVCPVQCIYEFDAEETPCPVSEAEGGSGVIENTHTRNRDSIAIFADTLLYVNFDERTSCTPCYQRDVCPVGAIYFQKTTFPTARPRPPSTHRIPIRTTTTTFFVQLSHDVFGD
jgi:ferredoxin